MSSVDLVSLICPLEEIALSAAYFAPELEEALTGKDVLHFADNKAAHAAAVNAWSRAEDLARIVSAMHARWKELGIDPWVEFVKSEANLADEPSRGEFARLTALGSVALRAFPWPRIDGW